MAELRYNPFKNDWVMVASVRQNRPQMPKHWCPFCPGSGKVVSIVKKDKVELFKNILKEEYTKLIGYEPTFYQSDAGQGATEVDAWR